MLQRHFALLLLYASMRALQQGRMTDMIWTSPKYCEGSCEDCFVRMTPTEVGMFSTILTTVNLLNGPLNMLGMNLRS